MDCIQAKEGITYDELDDIERIKIDKYNPPLNKRRGGGGRKSSLLGKYSSYGSINLNEATSDHIYKNKGRFLYRLLGYETISKSGETYYNKESKSVFFLAIELIVKVLSLLNILLIILEIYLRFTKETLLNRNIIVGNIFVPIIFFALFHYIRRDKFFRNMTILAFFIGIFLYFISYPIKITY